MDYKGFYDSPDYDTSMRDALANIVRGFKKPENWQAVQQGVQNVANVAPSVGESLARGAIGQIPGTPGDISATIRQFAPQTMQNVFGQRSMPTTEEILAQVPRATPTYQGSQQHEMVGQVTGPALAKLLKMGAEATKGMPVGNMIKNVDAFKIAQENAALPVSEGGLGLPKNNTAMDRAKAMGFTENVYHGTNADIRNFNPNLADTRRGTGTPTGSIVVSSEPATASTYAGEKPLEWIKSYEEGGNVMPLLINKGKNMSMNARQGEYTPNWREIYNPKYPDIETTNEFAQIAKEKGKQSATIKNVKDNAVMSGAEGDTTFIFDPSLIRSRFAAFDPKRIKEADILAAVAPLSLKEQLEEQFNKLKK